MTASATTMGQGVRRRRGERDDLEHTIMGVPARFMRPRLILIVTTAVLVLFGLLMIYSASSVMGLSNYDDPAYYLKRQALLVLVGGTLAVLVARVDYHRFAQGQLLNVIWMATTLVLIATVLLGLASHGAVRWITVAGQSLQPSEFAKITVILTGANLFERFFERQEFDLNRFLILFGVGVVVPVVLILAQPDKGTTLILLVTLIVMLYLAGMPAKWLVRIFVLVFIGAVVLSMRDEYSRQRILTMFDPWEDPYGDGYQLIQGFYAFGSGGLFGVGLGLSRQKYSYLPEAHNDFIFAIVGEECGLVGTLGVIVGFGIFVYEGIQIARYAPDLTGRLIAAGCTSLIAIQFLVNVMGVLGMTPLTGKPLPFLSYGGSSVISCLLLVGVIVSVSCQSKLPETAHDVRRSSISVVGSQGRARPRPASSRQGSSQGSSPSGLTLLDGGAGSSKRTGGRSSGVSTNKPRGGRERIDLGPSASERLRGGSGKPRLRDADATGNLGKVRGSSTSSRSRGSSRGGKNGRKG